MKLAECRILRDNVGGGYDVIMVTLAICNSRTLEQQFQLSQQKESEEGLMQERGKRARGEVFPHHPTRGSGERRISSPSGVRGAAPAKNELYAYFRSESRHVEHHFQYFLSDGGAPKRRGARENFPPFPLPLDGPD